MQITLQDHKRNADIRKITQSRRFEVRIPVQVRILLLKSITTISRHKLYVCVYLLIWNKGWYQISKTFLQFPHVTYRNMCVLMPTIRLTTDRGECVSHFLFWTSSVCHTARWCVSISTGRCQGSVYAGKCCIAWSDECEVTKFEFRCR